MLKKLSALLMLIALCLISLLPVQPVKADGFDMGSLRERYVIVVDMNDPGTALYGLEKNADEKVATGSTIKILTCLVALEKGNKEDLVSVSEKASSFSKYNSLMGIKQGEQWRLEDLLYGLMLPSGNDAAVAIAEHIAGSESAFAELMNQKAGEIGMSSSHFVTVHGKDNSNHYSTARDMAKLTAYALQNEELKKIVSTKEYSCTDVTGGHSIELRNTNRLLVDAVSSDGSFTPKSLLYPDAIGMKTGDTNAAGKCFIGAASRGGTTLIAVLLGGTLDDAEYLANSANMREKAKDPYNAQRFEDAANLFNYAFKQMSVMVTVQQLVDKGMQVSFPVQVQNYAPSDSNHGQIQAIAQLEMGKELQLMKPFYEAWIANIASVANVRLGTVVAPVNEGDVLGTVEYVLGDTVLFSSNLYASRSVKEGILSTQGTNPPSGGEQQQPSGGSVNLIGETVTVSKDKNLSAGKIALIVLAVVAGLGAVFLATAFIIGRVRRERRRRERAARRRRQQQIAQRNRERQR